jgi:hypothetical protein
MAIVLTASDIGSVVFLHPDRRVSSVDRQRGELRQRRPPDNCASTLGRLEAMSPLRFLLSSHQEEGSPGQECQ